MKLKLKKLTIESMGISVLLATMLTVCIASLSLIGWGVLWGVLVAVLYPVAEAGRKFYQENKCRHMTEFVESFNTDVPFAPLFFRKSVMSVNPEVSGITTTEGNVYLSASDWKVKK